MLEYFEKWFWSKKKGISALPLEKAKQRHHSSIPYVTVLTTENRRFVIDFAPPWVSVVFFDDEGRESLRYDFKHIESQRLFLTHAFHKNYRNNEISPISSVTFKFELHGSILIERRDFDSGVVVEKNSHADPNANWETYPSFGEYAAICRVDRGMVEVEKAEPL